MEDYAIKNVRVQDIPGLDLNGNTTITKRVTYQVGINGPFTLDYPAAEYTAAKVQADMQREVETLKAIGATSHRA